MFTHEDTQRSNDTELLSVDNWEGEELTQRVESELPTARSEPRGRPTSHRCASCLSRRETRWYGSHNECADRQMKENDKDLRDVMCRRLELL